MWGWFRFRWISKESKFGSFEGLYDRQIRKKREGTFFEEVGKAFENIQLKVGVVGLVNHFPQFGSIPIVY